MTAKTLGVLCYIDDTPDMIEDFSWLYKSWIHSGNWRTSDLIAICNPSVHDRLPDESGVIKIKREPLSQPGGPWAGYPFINSIGCLIGEHTAALADRYSHFLRTDADVFLTPKLVDFRPGVAVYGRGRYAENPATRRNIVDFANRSGLVHHGVFNTGSTLLTTSHEVLFFLHEQMTVCGLLLEEFKDDPGEWPGWFRGVLTLYAGELVANHYIDRFTRFAMYNVLDFESFLNTNIAATGIYHIHAFHSADDSYWSKHAWRAGRYKDQVVAELDRDFVQGYCHWIAATPVEEIKRLAGYPE